MICGGKREKSVGIWSGPILLRLSCHIPATVGETQG